MDDFNKRREDIRKRVLHFRSWMETLFEVDDVGNDEIAILFETLESIRSEYDDLMIETQVEHFLENGSCGKEDVEYGSI